MQQPYDRIAAEWAAARVTLREQDRRLLDRMIEGLPPGAEVLDLGCGTGRPNAEYLVAQGFRVTGVDQSAAMLAKARELLPGCDWMQAELDAVELDRNVSAVLCWDALFHLERARHQRVLTQAWQVLPPGGRLLFSTGGSAHPPFNDTMWGHEFFYDAHPPEEMVAMTEATGFRVLAAEMVDPPTGGRDKGKLAILAEKP
ncbi:MAG TPA: class I SAM-dependent methyltransferase [Opitutaceae bacterium]|nr:class I SAM-dependent methyltransferase [Opitutaceae bacterium]HRJ48786.1 class I SAM-dependent methyltransferase [Opitutaceae bacterium]